MTYAELAKARGITIPAARRLTLRHHWAKQTGNDGLVRVSVPLSALAKARKIAEHHDSLTDTVRDPTSSTKDAGSDTPSDSTRALESAVEGLREQLTIANQRAERAERRTEELQAALDVKTRQLNGLLANQKIELPTPRRRWWQWRS
jgi:hypothetical protein